MNLADIEKWYTDTPAIRNRWDPERFKTLVTQRVEADSALAPLEAHRASSLNIRLPDLEKNEFGGIACAYGVKVNTWMPTIIEQGAFKTSLSTPRIRERVKVLYQHGAPIGIPTHMVDLPEGLAVVGKISQTTLGNEVLTLMRDKVVDEISVGFEPKDCFFREKDGELWRHITEGELWEFSPVSRGANPGAKVTIVNSAGANFEQLVAQLLQAIETRPAGAHTQYSGVEKTLECFRSGKLSDAEIDQLVAGLIQMKATPQSPAPVIDVSSLSELERLLGA